MRRLQMFVFVTGHIERQLRPPPGSVLSNNSVSCPSPISREPWSFLAVPDTVYVVSEAVEAFPIGTTGSAVPEPSSVPLAGLAIGALVLLRRKDRP